MGKIEIKGPIISDGDQWIYDWFGIPATSPSKVNKALSEMKDSEDVEVIINSGGGSVYAGSEIYTALKSHAGKTVGKVVGIAASAASVIAMGVKWLEISPTAQIMVHRASTFGSGNKEDFEHVAGVLSGIDASIANAYEIKTGLSANELLDMMSKETWLTAQKAKELGFADAVMFETEPVIVNSIADSGGMLPQGVIDKIRSELKGELGAEEPAVETDAQTNEKLQLAKGKLNLKMTIRKGNK
ncbi:head maturation protease, ClpP-related [Anaerotignum sp. MB30-C6]|uniref:head maturation protease, ClpP-related n=1 Tax=Anaerotignum sp. MB30-C6 TaxID=3070814 RepID=UPI0027DC6AAE|nr:head maturation protease, ClpP-related [Anaerotignum sp. MB30-C6]WMI80910.1 Clp protease ClpP [Anaerotignum sp. MB30-C6]